MGDWWQGKAFSGMTPIKELRPTSSHIYGVLSQGGLHHRNEQMTALPPPSWSRLGRRPTLPEAFRRRANLPRPFSDLTYHSFIHLDEPPNFGQLAHSHRLVNKS